MIVSLKALIVVLIIASAVFRVSKPFVLLFSNEADFVLRRNLWYALTILAFLSPSFWLYIGIGALVLILNGRKDSNPAALYLFLLNVIPPVYQKIPFIQDSYLIDVDNALMVSFCVIVPATRRLLRKKNGAQTLRWGLSDYCIVAYLLLSAALYMHQIEPDGRYYPATPTDFLRRILESSIEIFAPYYLISRSSLTRKAIVDAIAALWLACLVMAPLAIFETMKGWLLYESIPARWNMVASFTSYIMRGSSVRAMASTAHSLSLGYLLAIALGLWLYLQTHIQSRVFRLSVTALLCLGLLATYSRGPWLCAVGIYFAFAALGPRVTSALFKAAATAAVAAMVVSLTPFGQRIARVIPFLGGQIDYSTIEYRERLWDRGWELILQSPFFGDQYVLYKLQDLRQGQGIIDFVNGYIAELLSTGFVGLSLFLLAVGVPLLRARSSCRRSRELDRDFCILGASLVSCILGTLFLWAFGGPDVHVLWALTSLAMAYVYVGRSIKMVVPGPVAASTAALNKPS